MNVLHISDLHLDCPIRQLGVLNESFDHIVTHYAQTVLDNILTCIRENHVDLLLIVGDTFHQPHISYKMQQIWCQFLSKCIEYHSTPCVIFGNHDYYHRDYYWFSLPEGVIIWDSDEVETKMVTTKYGERVALSAFSYTQSHITDNKIVDYPERYTTCDYHIGLYHGQPTGTYAPFSLQQMKEKNYDYWALGHIHHYEKLAERIYYCGTPQGKRNGEWQAGRGLLLTLTNDYFHCETVDLAAFYVIQKTIDIHMQSMEEIIHLLKRELHMSIPTIIDIHFSLDESIDDTLEKELYSSDFEQFVKEGISDSDIVFVRHISFSKANMVATPELIKMKDNYKKEDIFMSIAPLIFNSTDDEWSEVILRQRQSIVDDAFEQWLSEMNGGKEDGH